MSNPFTEIKRSLSTFETFSFGIVGVITWFLTFPAAHAALGVSALYIWIPGSIVSMFTNFQIKKIAPRFADVVGGTPIYTVKMLGENHFLSRYGGLGHVWGWVSLALINSYLFNDTIQIEFSKHGVYIDSGIIIFVFLVFSYLISLASQRLPGVVHMFLVYPLLILLTFVFGTLGIYGLTHISHITQLSWQTIGVGTFAQWYFFLMYTLYNGDIVTSYIPESKSKSSSIKVLTVVALFTPIVFILGSFTFALFAPTNFNGNLTHFLVDSLTPVFGELSTIITILLILFSTIVSSISGIGIAARTLFGLSKVGLLSKYLGFVSKRNTLDNAIITSGVVTLIFGLLVRDVPAMIAVTGLTCSLLYSIMRFAYWNTHDKTLPFKNISLGIALIEVCILAMGSWLINPYYLFFGILLPFTFPCINYISYAIFVIGRKMRWFGNFLNTIRPDFEIYNLMLMIGIVGIGSVFVYYLNTVTIENQALIDVIIHNPSLFAIFIILFLMIVILISGWTTIPQVVEIEHTREKLVHANANLHDDIKKREKVEKELWENVYLDTLTGLGNRKKLYEDLEIRLERFKYNFEETSLLFIDLDRFKLINDSLGHLVGDFVIQKTAESLSCMLSPHLTYRLGGDEFVTVICGKQTKTELEQIVKNILEVFTKPFRYEEGDIFITMSIGISTISDNHILPDDLVGESDIAMYYAKQNGLQSSFYSSNMKLRTQEIHELDTAIRLALENKEFTAYYQPIHNLKTLKLDSFEVLIRWFHPTKGNIPPSDFIPIAEKNGYIKDIGLFLFELVAREAQQILKIDPSITLSFNISAKQLNVFNINLFIQILEKYHLPPTSVNMEITESILIESSAEVTNSLQLLKDTGISIHLDDFGTGYSSLSYLQTFPIDVLKIDRSFVSNVENRKIARAVQIIADNIGIKTIAEGIETQTDFEEMKSNGCQYGQGYYFAKPMSFEDAMSYLNISKNRVEG
jgi:diguanylate cyclase (GGDEF)-like protein